MQLIFDTNVIRDNWFLKGPSMTVIEKFITLGKCKLIVPEIVILEAANLFRKEVTIHVKAVKKLNSLISREDVVTPSRDIEQICKDYEETLNKRLDELQVERLSYTEIPHKEIVSRALACRKPFRESDKGYRDTLLWEGVIKVANSDCTTFFITNDREDFASKSNEGQLHPDLVEDLSARGLPTESVCLCVGIKQFLNDHLLPYLQQVAGEAMEDLKAGKYKSFSIREWFIENHDQFITQLNEDVDSLYAWPQELENPELSYIEDPEDIRVGDVFSLEKDTVYIDAIAFADVTFDVFIFKPDYYVVHDKYPLDIQDGDWNDDYMWAQLTLYVPIKFSMTFNILSEQIEEFEVNGFEETFGWCKFCGAPVLNDAAETCYKCGKSLFSAK